MDPSPQQQFPAVFQLGEVADYVTGWLPYKSGDSYNRYTIEEVKSALHNALNCLENTHSGIRTRTMNQRLRNSEEVRCEAR